MICTKLRAFVAAVVAVGPFGFSAARTHAALTETDGSSSAQTTYDANILPADLIGAGTPTLTGYTTTGSIAAYAGDVGTYNGNRPNSFANLNDGAASSKQTTGANANLNDLSHDTYFDGAAMNSGASITYTLNAATSPNGYTLTSINSITGWADTTSFSNQKYTVSVAAVNNLSRFVPVATVNYAPFTGNGATANSSQVTLTDTTGALANNVGAIRFSILNNGGSGQVFRELDVTGQASTTTPPPPPPPVPSILPLGDSITYGDQTAAGGQIPGGYRTKLYTDLNNKGFSFNYVGSQTGNPSATLTAAGQVNNEGHNGYRVDQILNNLDASDGSGGNNGGYWLAGGGGTGRDAVNPNYILLHIGTNDILQHYDSNYSGTAPEANFISDLETRLTNLVNRLIADRPTAHLLLSNLIPIANHTNANGVDENTEVKAYNAFIQNTLIPSLRSAGDDVTFVDQYDNFVNADGSINTSLLPDNIHPNQQGYDIMGDTWASAVQAIPEPTSLSLFAAAGTLALARRRRTGR